MKKFVYEKFQLKGGKKNYILSMHDGDDWSGPCIEYFSKEKIVKIGKYSEDRKYLFELAVYNPEGTEYTFKVCKNGISDGPTLVKYGDVLYVGKYYTKDGFNGLVYRFEKNNNVRLQQYRHGVLIGERLDGYILEDNIAKNLPFEFFCEQDKIYERDVKQRKGSFTEYVAGDPGSHVSTVAAVVTDDSSLKIGIYRSNALNGTVMNCDFKNELYYVMPSDEEISSADFCIVYSVGLNGYQIVSKRNDGSRFVLSYCENNKKFVCYLCESDGKNNVIDGSRYEFPVEIDKFDAIPVKAATKVKVSGDTLSAEEKLNKLVGLTSVKSEISKLKAVIKKNPGKKPNLNMCFMGNPGTGKTEVARLLAEILYDEGILPTKKIVETDRSGLVAKYVGQTAVKTHEVFSDALGGVLFIDEAYSLYNGDDSDFGKEAIDALITDMENHLGEICVIFAGYRVQTEHMLAANPGFKSRIGKVIIFDDYTFDELKEIARYKLSADKYVIDDEVLDSVIKYIDNKKVGNDFGNAREVRNVIEKLYEYQAERTSGTRDRTITKEDFDALTAKKKDDKNELSAKEKLDNLIGLFSVKKEISKMSAYLVKTKGDLSGANLHMCFYGNPGTGKTEVARLLAEIFYDDGILPENKLIETDRSGLVSNYVGQTATKTHQLVKDAMGGVLFIDEAYGLYTGGSQDYGKEAIDALITDMENYRGKFCVIFAGYKEETEAMLTANQGFKSRINRYINFDNYDNEQLVAIAKSMIGKKRYSITDEALEEISRILSYRQTFYDFANAREVRNILESLYEIQAYRTVTEGLTDNWLIKTEDVKEYERDHNISFAKEANVKSHSFDLRLKDFVGYSLAANKPYNFNVDSIEQASVNIKVEKDGKVMSEGTGFFISPDGIIATCAHVVKNAEEDVTVIVNFKISDGQYLTKDYKAEIIAMNENDDTALLGIYNPKVKFAYYALSEEEKGYPELMTDIVMGGYPFGGDRFETITVTEGKVQSINKDAHSYSANTNIYVDLSGHPGCSGSGVIDKNGGKCIGIFAGCAVGHSGHLDLTINYAIPVKYLWRLLESVCDYDEESAYFSEEKTSPAEFHGVIYQCSRVMNELKAYSEPLTDVDNAKIDCGNIHIVKGDITAFKGDAIVNPINSRLHPGGGLSEIIFKKAGFGRLTRACEKIGYCEVGSSVVTEGFDLNVKKIIHAVGPHYDYDRNPERLLSSVYESCFGNAIKERCESIAFPSISTGTYRFPLESAVPIALRQMIKHSKQVKDIYVYCFDDRVYDAYTKVFDRLKNI